MKKDVQVICPNCQHSFSLKTAAIWQELHNSVKAELNLQLSAQQEELEIEKSEVQKLTFKLNKEKEELDEFINSTLEQKETKLRDSIETQISKEKAKEIQLLEDTLVKKTNQLSDYNRQSRELVILRQEMEEKEAEIVLKYEQRYVDFKNDLKLEADESHRQLIKQKEKIISDLKVQLDGARKKVDSYSSSLIGETQEQDLKFILSDLFPQDSITDVPVGAKGGDIIQELITLSGKSIGTFLYESKNVKTFSKTWIPKLKEDGRSIGAEVLILVTKSMPKELEGQKFGIKDDVFITTISSVRELVILLRYSTLKISQVMLTYKGKETKQSLLFEFLTSTEFKNIYETVLGQLDNLKASHDDEKKKLVKLWSEREKSLELAIQSTVELYGSLRGITGQVQEIKSLELALPKAG